MGCMRPEQGEPTAARITAGRKALGGTLRPFLALIFVVLQRAEFVVIRLLRWLRHRENSLIRGIRVELVSF